MLALRLSGSVVLGAAPEPVAGPGEAVVQVLLAGICGTDLALARGYADFHGTLGHEFVGRVEHCDEASWIGRRVVAEINVCCGRCEYCASGLRQHCSARAVLGIRSRDGCFAERLVVPIANLHLVPDALPDTCAVFTEPVAAALQILAQVPLVRGDAVAVLGDGKLGLLIAMGLIRHGCDVTVVGRHARKLSIAQSLGARTADPLGLPPQGFSWVVEASGSASGLALAIGLVRPRGTLVLKSTLHGATPLVLNPVVVDELTIVGSRCGAFAPALAALADGSIDPRVLIDHVVPLEQAEQGFALARTPGVLKVLLDMRRPSP